MFSLAVAASFFFVVCAGTESERERGRAFPVFAPTEGAVRAGMEKQQASVLKNHLGLIVSPGKHGHPPFSDLDPVSKNTHLPI